ncbi:hypothetical protein H6775_03820 [Candidatus Nomurabacteria bacterium]|nr:hypothetical protein [Candidatus Nomurabacteria bacterium]
MLEPIFLDIETLGFNPFVHPITEIGLVDISGKVLINKKLPVTDYQISQADPVALQITNFNAIDHLTLPHIRTEAALIECQAFWEDKVIVGSNPTFDMTRLEILLYETLKQSPTWFYKPIDVCAMYFQMTGRLCRLGDIASTFELTLPTHGALVDAMSVREVYMKLRTFQNDSSDF